jgi:hypothetical protein
MILKDKQGKFDLIPITLRRITYTQQDIFWMLSLLLILVNNPTNSNLLIISFLHAMQERSPDAPRPELTQSNRS